MGDCDRCRLMGKKIFPLVTIVFTVIVKISAVFIEIPLPLNVTSEQQALFRCTHPTADTIAWRVNNTSVRNLPDSVVQQIQVNGTLTSILTIEAHQRYNETQVDCLALFFDQTTAADFSPTVTLRIQGPLQKIPNLDIDINLNELKLSWDAPFSLDITNIDPDIIYFVQVINTTCGNGSILFRNYTIRETELNLFGYSQHHAYEVTITPKSNVEGAKNGTTLITQVEFVKYRVTHLNICFEDVLFGAHAQLTMVETIDGLLKTKPTSYSVLLVSNDGINEKTMIHTATIDEMARTSIELGLQPLLLRRRWNYTVIAYDCNQHPLTSTAELSTHDVQNVQIYSPNSGQIQVSGILVQGAAAVGIVIIVYPLDHVNLNVYYFEALEMLTNTIMGTVSGLSAGQYGISVFVLEESGLPFNRSASAPKSVTVHNGKDMAEPETTIEYKVTQASTSGHGICVECSFLDKSAEYCVVIIHEKILCFGMSQCESNLTNIAASFKISRSGDKGHGCVQNINVSNLQVGVIGGRQVPHLVTTTESKCCTYDIGLTLAILGVLICFIGVTLLTLILTRQYYKRARSRRYSMPVTESQEPESRYQDLPMLRDINSELPTYDEVAAGSDFPSAYLGEMRESPLASVNTQTAQFTIENLVKYLVPVADKWKELGSILFVTESILDEIFTNKETDEACLQEMLKYYLMRSDVVHDWDEISTALRKLGEETLANELGHMQYASDPVEVVAESTGGCETHDDLAITMPQITPNEATEDDPTSGVTLLVGLSVSMFRAPKPFGQMVSSADRAEVTGPIPETAHEADPAKSLCICLQHDDQREIDQESVGESCDTSSSIHVAELGHPNEDYSRECRPDIRNPSVLQQYSHECHHVPSDSEEWHSSSLDLPYGAQPLQLESMNDQFDTCTTEPHNVIRFR